MLEKVTEARLPLEPTAATKTPLQAFASRNATVNLPRLPAVTNLRRPLAVTRMRSLGLNPRPAIVTGEVLHDLQRRPTCRIACGSRDGARGGQRQRRDREDRE